MEKRIDLGEWLGDSVSFLFKNFFLITLLLLPVIVLEYWATHNYLPAEFFQKDLSEEQMAAVWQASMPVLLAINFAFEPIIAALAMALVFAKLNGVYAGPMMVFKRTAELVLVIWLSNLLLWSAIYLGLIAFIAPGLYFYLRLSLTLPIVINEGLSPFKGMAKSWGLTSSVQGPLAGGFILLGLVILLPIFAISGLDLAEPLMFAWTVFTTVVMSVIDVFKCRVYNHVSTEG